MPSARESWSRPPPKCGACSRCPRTIRTRRAAGTVWWTWARPSALLLAHHLFRWRQCFDERRTGEEPLRVLHERRGPLGQGHAVVVEPPQERADRHVEHRELVAQHVLLLCEHRRHLRELVGHVLASAVLLLLVSVLERLDMGEKLHFELEQK